MMWCIAGWDGRVVVLRFHREDLWKGRRGEEREKRRREEAIPFPHAVESDSFKHSHFVCPAAVCPVTVSLLP